MHRAKEPKKKQRRKSPDAEHVEGIDESKLNRTNAQLDKRIKRQRQDACKEGDELKSGWYSEVKQLFTASNLQVPYTVFQMYGLCAPSRSTLTSMYA